MNNNNYESMRAFLVSGLLVCSCAVAQVQADEANQFTSSAPRASLEKTLFDTASLAEITSLEGSEANFADLVESIETEFGPFDARLSEPLLSAGDLLAERGDYLGAINYLERALYIMRINQGLYSEPQIAIVERLIDSNVALENWDAVDQNYRHLQFLYNRLFDRGSLQWDRGISQVADWHVIAINNSLGGGIKEHLQEANKLFKLRLEFAEEDPNVDQNVLAVLRHNIEFTSYHMRKQEEAIKTTRIYTRLESRYRDDRADSLASLD